MIGTAYSLCQALQCFMICQSTFLVNLYRFFGICQFLCAHKYIYLTAADVLLHLALDGLLRKNEGAGQTDGGIQIAVVYGAKLHRKFAAIHRFHGATVAGHALNQCDNPLFMGVEIISPRNPLWYIRYSLF